MASATSNDDPIERAVAITAEMTRTRSGQKPTEALVYSTTRAVALEATEERVYLVTYAGDFTLHAFRGPPGARAPEGEMMTYVVRPATGEILDLGLELRAKDFSAALGLPRRVRV